MGIDRLYISCLTITLVSIMCISVACRFECHGPRFVPKRSISKNTRILEKDPNNINALIDRGEGYSNSGLYKDALADFNKALSIDPERTNIYSQRGLTYTTMGEYDKAIADYSTVLEDINQEIFFHFVFDSRGYAYYKKGDYDRAIEDFDRALAIDPKLPTARINKTKAKFARFFDWF